MARNTPIAILIVVSLFCLVGGGWAKLVGTMVEVCNTVGASEPVRLMIGVLGVTAVVDSAVSAAVLAKPFILVVSMSTAVATAVRVAVTIRPEEELVEGVKVANIEVPETVDCSDLSIAENGYGSSEVVKVVSQQFGPPRPCPAAPAQHQLLLLGSQRLTSSKPSN